MTEAASRHLPLQPMQHANHEAARLVVGRSGRYAFQQASTLPADLNDRRIKAAESETTQVARQIRLTRPVKIYWPVAGGPGGEHTLAPFASMSGFRLPARRRRLSEKLEACVLRPSCGLSRANHFHPAEAIK